MKETSYAFLGPLLLASSLALIGNLADRSQPATMRAGQLSPASSPRCDLLVLDGAGEALVEKIILIRAELDLSQPGSLRWVPGIGGRRLHQWWPWIKRDGG